MLVHTPPPPPGQSLPRLGNLNVENNDVKDLPLRLGRMPRLHTLLIGGNPQRLVRHAVIAKGSRAVLDYLASRAADDVEEEEEPHPGT